MKNIKIGKTNKELSVHYVSISSLKPATYNPRHWSKEAITQLNRYRLIREKYNQYLGETEFEL